MASQITVRGVSAELSRRLHRASRERGTSLNALVLQLLEAGVGVNARRTWLDGWATATDAEADELAASVADARKVDPRDWR